MEREKLNLWPATTGGVYGGAVFFGPPLPTVSHIVATSVVSGSGGSAQRQVRGGADDQGCAHCRCGAPVLSCIGAPKGHAPWSVRCRVLFQEFLNFCERFLDETVTVHVAVNPTKNFKRFQTFGTEEKKETEQTNDDCCLPYVVFSRSSFEVALPHLSFMYLVATDLRTTNGTTPTIRLHYCHLLHSWVGGQVPFSAQRGALCRCVIKHV